MKDYNNYKYYHRETNEALMMKVRIGDVGPNIRIYWTPEAGIGGVVKKHTENTVIIIDSGCDGNTYTDREVDKDTAVWIEIPTTEVKYIYK